MKELELKKPIIAHGETLSVLEFDEPTGKDVRELGYPYQMNQDESVRLLAHVVGIPQLADILPGGLIKLQYGECLAMSSNRFL